MVELSIEKSCITDPQRVNVGSLTLTLRAIADNKPKTSNRSGLSHELEEMLCILDIDMKVPNNKQEKTKSKFKFLSANRLLHVELTPKLRHKSESAVGGCSCNSSRKSRKVSTATGGEDSI